MPDRITSISFIGSGNVAYGLGMAFKRKVKIEYVLSKNLENATALARKLKAKSTTEINDLFDSDCVIMAVPDAVINDLASEWANNLKGYSGLPPTLVHTAGNVSINALQGLEITFPCGVFYPLQTFTYGRRLSIKDVPIFISTQDGQLGDSLLELASKISTKVYHIKDELRSQLHLPAVFINNFVNHLILKSEELMRNNELPLDYFMPLLKETIKKAKSIGAKASQTGPARRNDRVTIEHHLKKLESNQDLKSFYQLFTESILKTYHENHRRD